jgi:hypothetical protein
MTELTTSQRTLMRSTVIANRSTGQPLDVSSSSSSAAALVRQGYAQWYPPIEPLGYHAAVAFVNDRTQITPTSRAQDWVDRYGPGTDV